MILTGFILGANFTLSENHNLRLNFIMAFVTQPICFLVASVKKILSTKNISMTKFARQLGYSIWIQVTYSFLVPFFSHSYYFQALTCYLEQRKCPPWTSYFIKYDSIIDDQRGKSHFNWTVKEGHNYHILRTGCYPYIKYHCTKRPHQDLSLDDLLFRIIKILNLGECWIPLI